MENFVSLAVSLLALSVVIRVLAFVAGGGRRSAGTSKAGVLNQPSADPEVDQDAEPGMPGRWNSPLERDHYYRARGHNINWME